MNIGLFILRIVVGAFFAGHGAQKLFGSFGGHGPKGTAAFFETLGMRPGRRHAYAAGIAEFGAGILLMLGLLTPLAACAITAVMTVAILTVHLKNGPWSTDGGYEYNLILMAAVFALAGAGVGAWSLDNAIGWGIDGPWWAVGELGVGFLAGFAAFASGRRYTAEQERRVARPATPATATASPPTARFDREPAARTRVTPPTPHTGEAPLERTPVDRRP